MCLPTPMPLASE
uniref:Uncharacterized protein n=1 Tax=Arundo donax TaxID=35708 RepID=A0A0A9J0I0_ARUDO